MATGSPTTAAPTTVTRVPRAALRLALPAAIVVAVATLLRVVYHPWYLNYDARYALLWARDLWRGYRPDYGADFAPTPHPLQTAMGFLALPFDGSDQVMSWTILLAFGVLIWLVYRLGSELFSPWVGAVTALAVLTRPALERDALLAYQDVAFAALIVGAVLVEVRRPRRGLPVLALLAFAGLFRPEAWLLSGLYVLYLWRGLPPRTRTVFCALAAVAPVTWMLTDLLIAHDALHSLHGTAALADQADRRRHIGQVPYWTAQYFGFTLREPVLVGVAIGLVFGWLHRRRAATLPVVVAVAMTAVFAIGPLFGLPLIGRYLRTPAILFAVFYGLAVCGWLLLPSGRDRRLWLGASILVVGLTIAFLPSNVDMLRGLHKRIERDGKLYSDLRLVGEAAVVREAFDACQPLSAADHRPIPYVRYWLDGKPGSVGTVESGASPLGRLLLLPRRTPLVRHFYKDKFPTVTPPAGYRAIYANRSWSVYAAPACVKRPRA